MTKCKLFFNMEKEEKWLESMTESGWLLTKASFLYHFERITPQKTVIRVDYREFKSKRDFLEYCTMFEDSGWRHIAGTRYHGMQYFLKVREDGTEDIFSDKLSQAGRYKRISNIWFLWAFTFLMYQLVLLFSGNWSWADVAASPKEWYLTPGLWELEGFSFWFSFLFETPFALMRGIGVPLFPLIGAVCYACFAIKFQRLYKKAIKDDE